MERSESPSLYCQVSEDMQPIVAVGRNCWRIERATEARVIVDASDYYRVIAEAMDKAQKRIFIVGWDFDTRISLAPDREGSYHASLGHFFLELARKKPDRQIDILKWNFGALKQFLSIRATYWLVRWWLARPINLKFDSSHPKGCSHHQKIVVIDESLAACGGIDIAMRRWDTREHKPDDPCRKTPNGHDYQPWHDVTMLMRGDIAGALGDLGRERWKVATTRDLEPVPDATDDWPEDLEAHFKDVDIAIARTRAEYSDVQSVRENEALVIDMIEHCERFAYIENQYFTSPKIAAAILGRLAAPNPPEIVLVTPITADGWLEQVAMDATRLRLMKIIGAVDPEDRFRIYTPKTAGGQDIYVHAKVMIVDDAFLKIGSANMNNRSLGLDSECDLALLDEKQHRACVRQVRERLMAEHLGASEEQVRETFERTGSLRATIAELTRAGDRRLEPLPYEKPEGAACFIAETELLDPKSPDAMFESMTRRTLFDPLRGPFKRLRRRGRKLPV